ncbi:MAG: type II toxin-antitoxin system RelE/ParE family toxin [Kofleriaceae bacterium]|nr:type II toxin-antitoxin system RelE/ParE family toxin [Kofleriaceae bacterium]MBP9171925.1 type II toxin-antitoxin system RelE/ParE family toxin [Kofleriaceae bacterium]MBP9859299.1 type II toxin-antitoxin system RelE/ParE family toxin [Kofleriaceae bacterium]
MSAARVVFLPVARREIDEADDWWRANRASPDAVLEAIERFVALASDQPHLGARLGAPLDHCRRLLLSDIGYWVYYRVVEARVEVLSFWHVRRAGRPRL